MSIESNIAARKAAEETFEFVSSTLREDLREHGTDALAKAWRILADMVDGVCCVDRVQELPDVAPMSTEEVKRFGRSKMPDRFRKHAGDAVDDVPMSYLTYIDESNDGWNEELRRYLRSKEIQEEQRRDD